MTDNRKLLAAAVIALLASGAVLAKDADIVVQTVAPPSLNASEDYPITYPGGPAPAPVNGALDGDDSTYNRVFDCADPSGTGTAVFYDTITLTHTGTGDATVNVALDCTTGDGFLTAYAGSFDPAAPLTNCVDSNDDTNGFCPVLNGLVVPAGDTVVLVVGSFDNGETFDWTADFSGTVPVELQSFQVE